MTSGADSRRARRSSFLVPSSPSSALSERASSSRTLSRASSVSSSISPPSPLALAPAVPRRHQLRASKDLRRLVQLIGRRCEAPRLLQLGPLPLAAPRPGPSYRLVGVGYQLRYLAGPDVPLSDPAVLALALVVVEVASPTLPGHPLTPSSCATPWHHPRLCNDRGWWE